MGVGSVYVGLRDLEVGVCIQGLNLFLQKLNVLFLVWVIPCGQFLVNPKAGSGTSYFSKG